MINGIIDGISMLLAEIFPDWDIYTEKITQGMKEPCFFVYEVNSSADLQLGTRQKRTRLFDIHFFTSEGREQMRSVAQKFYDNFDPLPLPDGTMIHAANLRSEIEDDVLHLFVNYNTVTQHSDVPDAYMEEIDVTGGVNT